MVEQQWGGFGITLNMERELCCQMELRFSILVVGLPGDESGTSSLTPRRFCRLAVVGLAKVSTAPERRPAR